MTRDLLLERLDDWCHRMRLPYWLHGPICDAYDKALGVPDEPQHFPGRHILRWRER